MAVPGIVLGDWRSSNDAKRELIRSLIHEAVTGTIRINTLVDRLKRQANYDQLSEKDKNGFNVMASQARTIAERWNHIDERTQRSFLDGHIPFSRLYAEVRKF